MAFFHFLRAGGPIFASFLKKNRSVLLKAEGTERNILVIKLNPRVNISPAEIRRDFAHTGFNKTLPFTSKWKSEDYSLSHKFTVGYALADVGMLFVGLIFCFYKAGYYKPPKDPEEEEEEDEESSEELKPMEESGEPPEWVLSTAQERTYAAITSKVDFANTLGTEEQIQRLVAHSKTINLRFSTLLKNTKKMAKDLGSVNQSIKALKNRLLVIEEHLGVTKRSASKDDDDDN